MSTTQEFPDGFEQWMLHKNWSSLNEDELKQLESEGINEEEYLRIQQMLKHMQDWEDEEIIPKPELRDALLQAFDAGPERKGKIIPMPVWIATFVAAAAVLVLFIWVLPSGEKASSTVADIPQAKNSAPVQTEIPVHSNQTEVKPVEIEVQEEAKEMNPPIVVQEELSLPDVPESVSEDMSNAGAPMHSNDDNVVSAKTEATVTGTSNAMPENNFSTNLFESQVRYGNSAINESMISKAIVVNNTQKLNMSSNKKMLDVLVTVY